jgi:hypothetical protein
VVPTLSDRLADDPLLLQLLNAPPAGRLGEPDAIGDLGGRELAVPLQQVQDFGIELIHATPFLIMPVLSNIVAQLAEVRHRFATA